MKKADEAASSAKRVKRTCSHATNSGLMGSKDSKIMDLVGIAVLDADVIGIDHF